MNIFKLIGLISVGLIGYILIDIHFTNTIQEIISGVIGTNIIWYIGHQFYKNK